MVVKKRHTTFFFPFRQVLEKSTWLQITCWPVVLVGHFNRWHPIPDTVQRICTNIEIVLKCMLGSFTSPSTRMRIVHFTIFVCENQVSVPPLQFLTVPSLRTNASFYQLPSRWLKIKLPQGFQASFAGVPHIQSGPLCQATPKSHIAGLLHCN